MSTVPSFPVCRHYVSGSRAPSVCHRCQRYRPRAPQYPDSASSYSAAEQLAMERYLQEVRIQQLRDVQALNNHQPSPYSAWRNDRSVANSIIGGAGPSSLPSSYLYARTIDDQDLGLQTGAASVQQEPSYGPRRNPRNDSQRRAPYASQQGQGQSSAGYENGLSAPNGSILPLSQDSQTEPRQTEDTNGTEASVTPNTIPSAHRHEAGYRPYRR